METQTDDASLVSQAPPGSALEVLRVATRLGLTSFGGPIAHLGYFHAEYVERRRWLDAQTYADLVALCQFLPGPASSQVGIAVGIFRAGVLGGLAAWLGFTLPSALALVAFAYGLQALGGTDAGWLHGLKVVAVAVVAQAVWGMARTLTPDRATRHHRRARGYCHARLAHGHRPGADSCCSWPPVPPHDPERLAGGSSFAWADALADAHAD